MFSHKLTREDEWFLQKRQIDVLSRTPFDVGHVVVVCDHKHVMLADYYEGKCHVCGSSNTVPFKRANIEYSVKPMPAPRKAPNPPRPTRQTKIRAVKNRIKVFNRILSIVLCILLALTIALIALDVIPADSILERLSDIVISRIEYFFNRVAFIFDNVFQRIKQHINEGNILHIFDRSIFLIEHFYIKLQELFETIIFNFT